MKLCNLAVDIHGTVEVYPVVTFNYVLSATPVPELTGCESRSAEEKG